MDNKNKDKTTSPLSSAGNGAYLEELYQQYQENPETLSSDWQAFFHQLENASPSLSETSTSHGSGNSRKARNSYNSHSTTTHGTEAIAQPYPSLPPSTNPIEKELGVYLLIDAYRNHGHLKASLNPLGNDNGGDNNNSNSNSNSEVPDSNGSNSSYHEPSSSALYELSLDRFGLEEEDLKKKFVMGSVLGLENSTLQKTLNFLNKTYCGNIALQLTDGELYKRNWLLNEFETESLQLSKKEKRLFFQILTQIESLEKFLHHRFIGQKRFSIEGAEALIPMLEFLCWKALQMKDVSVKEMVIGMAHRGRINVLNNFMGKALELTLAEFAGCAQIKEDVSNWENDVKYHLGFSADKETPFGTCHISLAFNPSHLESVNAVVLGMTRAKQRQHQDTEERKRVLPLLIHGDAAFAGQGVVTEALQLSQLQGYTVGGTIHIVMDNQVGFTTNPQEGRSSYYASDVVKVINAPVLHVNADDLEACLRAVHIAFKYRHLIGEDILIRLVSYRRYGHNEGDEPSFTQPLMYKSIAKHPSIREIYGKQLLQEGILDKASMDQFYKESRTHLQNTLDKVKKKPPHIEPLAFKGFWQGLRRSKSSDFEKKVNTTFPLQVLKNFAQILGTCPESFSVHPKLQKIWQQRLNTFLQKQEVDWAMAELLCYGSLLDEGFSIRISGQDSVRGTFSHRHALFTDYETQEVYNPFTKIGESRGKEFCIYNSPLSEMAVLGFEYGNSIVDPTFLTIWEAQFGDFSNGAQVIIDQFICSGESKWQRMSGLVLLLPHGYEGMGPEHSSARLERFLNLCAQDNIQVCNLTTPAQLFHVLRRQMKRAFRKPLVIMSPKSLLRHPRVRSGLKELAEGSFREILLEKDLPLEWGAETESKSKSTAKATSEAKATSTAKATSELTSTSTLKSKLNSDLKQVRHIFFCSGKVYYELLEEKEKLQKQQKQVSMMLVRLEQLYPFPQKQILQLFALCPKLEKVYWVQEEPKNMGAWSFILSSWQEMLEKVAFSHLSLNYIGRERKASPATGSAKRHKEEQDKMIQQCFQVFHVQKGLGSSSTKIKRPQTLSKKNSGKKTLSKRKKRSSY